MEKFLIAGLGNIGGEYANTRHNIGFKVLDHLADVSGTFFSTQRYGDVAELKIRGRKVILLKPNTYMNLSGKAVSYWLQSEKIKPENLLVVTDDLALPFGKIRIRPKGSAGGHNGLKNISLVLNSEAYPRLRFGVGSDFNKGNQVDYVLGEWSEDESKSLQTRIELSAKAVQSFCSAGLSTTMNQFNNQ